MKNNIVQLTPGPLMEILNTKRGYLLAEKQRLEEVFGKDYLSTKNKDLINLSTAERLKQDYGADIYNFVNINLGLRYVDALLRILNTNEEIDTKMTLRFYVYLTNEEDYGSPELFT